MHYLLPLRKWRIRKSHRVSAASSFWVARNNGLARPAESRLQVVCLPKERRVDEGEMSEMATK